MDIKYKSQQQILEKFGIKKLNEMQLEAQSVISSNDNTIILSPTGTGKTLAFLLPIISELDKDCSEIQSLIIVPTRELAIQIEQVIRQMGTGFKVNAVYGGRSGSLDKIDIQHRPAILVGTPGRVADHLQRENFDSNDISTIVLDEFDKSLEIGFEKEMSAIFEALNNVTKRILTSATIKVKIPEFLKLDEPVYVNYLKEGESKLLIKTIISPDKDKLDTLVDSLERLGNAPGIVFCSFKETISRISEYLTINNINHGIFHGGMEQVDRERTLIKFRNGTHQILLATDLAARGIDVPDIQYIMHYHVPIKEKEFTHRNGRTARMKKGGTAYVLKWQQEELPDFIQAMKPDNLKVTDIPLSEDARNNEWQTLYITGGRRDKISKGDIAGLFFKQGKLGKDELGVIEIKQDCAFVGVKTVKVDEVLPLVTNNKLKKKKVRVTVL